MHGIGRIIASIAGSRRWRCVLIEAGRSKNGVTYTPEELRSAIDRRLFEGLAVNLYPALDASGRPIFGGPISADHVSDDTIANRTPANQAGFVVPGTVEWNESARRVEGVVETLPLPLGSVLQRALEATSSAGALGSIGLSIEGEGPLDYAGRASIRSLSHVAVVSRASAGGAFEHRIAASTNGVPIVTILDLLRQRFPRLAEGLATDASDFSVASHLTARAKADDAAAGELATFLGNAGDAKRLKESADHGEVSKGAVRLLEALRTEAAKATKDAADEQKRKDEEAAATARLSEAEKAKKASDAALKDLQIESTALRVDRALGASRLPLAVCARLRESFKGKVASADEIEAAVKAEAKLVDDLLSDRAFGGTTVLRESRDRTRDLLAHIFNPGQVAAPKEGVPDYAFDGVELFRRHITGGIPLTEALYGGDAGRKRIAESVNETTSLKTLQDAMNIALLAAYIGHHAYDGWKKITRTVFYPNFRTNHVVKVPYYGNLPTVAKGAPYEAISTTTESEQTIALAKYGAIESILLEDVLNGDFVDLWQQRLRRLGQAAMETRSEVVHAKHRDATQPSMADTYTLTSSSRSPVNEGTAVMSDTLATAIATVMLAIKNMMLGTGGSGVAKGVIPKYVVIPPTKMAAYNAVLQGVSGGVSGLDFPSTAKRMGWFIPEPIVDLRTTNDYDHYFFADPNEAEVLRVGELVGRNGPRLTIADAPNVGAMFTQDKLEARIDDIFSVAAVDHLGIYGNDAAS